MTDDRPDDVDDRDPHPRTSRMVWDEALDLDDETECEDHD